MRVDASGRLVDFSKEDVDVAIRYGAGNEPGMWTKRLFPGREKIFPVCSPLLLQGPRALRSPSDLRSQVLLHNAWGSGENSWAGWRRWLEAVGVRDVDTERGPRFTTWTMAIQAAVEGQGVALASALMAGEELHSDRLVRPFEASVQAPSDLGFYLLTPHATVHHPKVRALCEWVLRDSERGAAEEGETDR